jgi:hypothetical protein
MSNVRPQENVVPVSNVLKLTLSAAVSGSLLLPALLSAETVSPNTAAQVASKLDLKRPLTLKAEFTTEIQAAASEFQSRLVLNEFEVSMNEITSTVKPNKRWIVSGSKKGTFTSKELDRLVKALQKESPGRAGTVTLSFDQSN